MSLVNRDWVYVSTWPDFCEIYARSVAVTSGGHAAVYEVSVDVEALEPDPDSTSCPGDGLSFRVRHADVLRQHRSVSAGPLSAPAYEAWRCTARHDDGSLVVHPRYDRLAPAGRFMPSGNLVAGPDLWARMRTGGCTS